MEGVRSEIGILFVVRGLEVEDWGSDDEKGTPPLEQSPSVSTIPRLPFQVRLPEVTFWSRRYDRSSGSLRLCQDYLRWYGESLPFLLTQLRGVVSVTTPSARLFQGCIKLRHVAPENLNYGKGNNYSYIKRIIFKVKDTVILLQSTGTQYECPFPRNVGRD